MNQSLVPVAVPDRAPGFITRSLAFVRRRAAIALLAFLVLLSGAPAFATGTTTPIATVTTAIDFTDLQTDLTAFMTALLALFIVLIAFRLGINWLKKLATG